MLVYTARTASGFELAVGEIEKICWPFVTKMLVPVLTEIVPVPAGMIVKVPGTGVPFGNGERNGAVTVTKELSSTAE